MKYLILILTFCIGCVAECEEETYEDESEETSEETPPPPAYSDPNEDTEILDPCRDNVKVLKPIGDVPGMKLDIPVDCNKLEIINPNPGY